MTAKDMPLRRMKTYQAGLIQSRAFRNIGVFMDERLGKYNLSLPQWLIIGALLEYSQLSMKQIADMLDVTPPFATRMCTELERKQLISRTPDDIDARSRIVKILPAGRKLADGVEEELRKDLRNLLRDISVEDLEGYLKVLRKLSQL